MSEATMITDDGRGYAPEPDDAPPFAPPRVPGPAALDRDYHDDRSPETMRRDWHREQLGEPEPETDRERVLREDRTARLERMIWRNAFLGLYVFGLLLYAGWALLARTGIAWNLSAFVVLIGGGLIPGLFLVARESGEREVEWNRVKPEPRSGTELPGLRRPLGQYPDDVLDGR